MNLQYKDFEKILNIGISLSKEKDRNHMLIAILEKGMEVTNCDAGTLYLYENNELTFKLMKTLSKGINRGMNEPIDDMPPVPMEEKNVCSYSAIHREVVNIPDVYNSSRFDFSGPRKYDSLTGYRTKSQLVVPLENNENELIGVLQLINAMDETGNVIAFDPQYEIIIRSLGSMAAIELTNLSYVEALKMQIYSFVEALTTALEERTPYNALHTKNVEKYVCILADYITKLNRQGKCEEKFEARQIEQLRLAALLHDIGKMVVPLSIMNKATRLDKEIEKIDERFKLLKALYEIDMLRGSITSEEYREIVADLDEELEFIHKIDIIDCVDDEAYEHICRLAVKKHVDKDGNVLPYLTEREVSCLSIRSGTLTMQERKEMENHVVMTSKILEKVQFYKGFSMVPKWVGAHHEYLDGSGYPKQLKGDELDLETRLLTVVDIYDALTASDRPYKDPISKEGAIDILKNMANRGKVDLKLVEWLDEALEQQK
ncbi:MAG: HD domain-containing protein [Lachnospiraceae bacterium]|nr:HD domain-containing protein [Lachnospiraceae bacterium]